MADLAVTTPPPTAARVRWLEATTGALLGVVLWLECIAIGLPMIAFESPRYGVIPFAALAAALVVRTRFRNALGVTCVALAIVIAVVAYTPIMRRPTNALIRSQRAVAGAADAVVVLSGGVNGDGHLKPNAVDRLLTGLSLIRGGVAPTLIVSRERRGGGGNQVTSDIDQQRLIGLLDRPIRLLVVDSVFSTRDEAVKMRAVAQTLGITRLAVVTSPMHTYRACATFEKVGFVVTCVPSESRDVALRSLSVMTDRVRALQLWLYEMAALAKYRAQRWI